MEKEILKAYRTYEGFFAIDRTSFQEKIRYYKGHMQEISFLPFQNRITIDYYFLSSYFEVGDYAEYLKRVDLLIETVIEHNIYTIEEEIDPYKELLFKKCACLFNQGEYDKSIFILKQLRRMYPAEKKINHLLHYSLRKKFSKEKINFKACCVLLYFTAGIVIGLKIFYVENFHPEYSKLMDGIWLSLFLIATSFILANEVYIYMKAKRYK